LVDDVGVQDFVSLVQRAAANTIEDLYTCQQMIYAVATAESEELASSEVIALVHRLQGSFSLLALTKTEYGLRSVLPELLTETELDVLVDGPVEQWVAQRGFSLRES
jgi:hypothetical protein